MYLAADNYNYNKVFNVGIYVRLSREDEDRNGGYSDSIINQKDFLTRFVLENAWNLVDIYIDDGISGTTFDRPGFQRMIRDAEKKRINMIVTKDLSRLGRDYIETGHYLDRYFPAYNIRYIAVNDGIDTFATNNSNNDMSPFKSVINDMYARDISKKVRSIFDNKRMNGEFIGAFAPFGYKKHPADKGKLIIDDVTAPIIKKIFDMYIYGSGYTHIASTLNLEDIPSPVAYKAITGNYKNERTKISLWNHEYIKKILTNPTYSGDLAQNKFSKVSYKVKKLKTIPKDHWVIVEGTHEPIIDKKVFQLVQNMIGNGTGKSNKEGYDRHLLSGLIYCGDCGEKMTFTKTSSGNSYTICSKYKRFRRMNLCKRHSVLESKLEDLLCKELRNLAKQALNLERLGKIASNKLTTRKADNIIDDVKKTEYRLTEIKKIIKKLYEDKLKEIITEHDFIDMSQEYNKEREDLNKRLEKLLVIMKQEQEHSNNETFISTIKSFISFEKLDRATLIKLLDKVEIFEDNRIKICYKFQNPLM
jgi:Site-specific recombinases, DNA invertase Pin homologs